jgi:hypothetical protein
MTNRSLGPKSADACVFREGIRDARGIGLGCQAKYTEEMELTRGDSTTWHSQDIRDRPLFERIARRAAETRWKSWHFVIAELIVFSPKINASPDLADFLRPSFCQRPKTAGTVKLGHVAIVLAGRKPILWD